MIRIGTVVVLALVGTTSVFARGVGAQNAGDVHPGKTVWADAESWPGIAPGESPLRNFEPFRAVYGRVYRDQQGQERRDRVIITAERVAWGPEGAIMVTLIDAGSVDYDDTTARVQTRIFAEADQRLIFHISPAPGRAKDYLLIHADEGPVRATFVEGATGQATLEDQQVPLPQLGTPALWLVGSMALEGGEKIRFADADAPAASSILGARPYLVSERETFDAGPAGSREAWVVSYPLGMTNGRVMQTLISDRPPYLLGKRPLDLDTNETTEIGTLRLLEFSTFGG